MKQIKLFTYFLLPFTLASCSLQSNKQEEAKNFLFSIKNYDNEIYQSSERFQLYNKKAGLIAQKDKNFQLSQLQIDTLAQLFSNYIDSIDKAISKIGSLNEFDTSFHLKSLCLSLLTREKTIHMSIIPSFLKAYKIGWSNIDELDRQVIMSSIESFKNSIVINEETNRILKNELNNFKLKYKLTK